MVVYEGTSEDKRGECGNGSVRSWWMKVHSNFAVAAMMLSLLPLEHYRYNCNESRHTARRPCAPSTRSDHLFCLTKLAGCTDRLYGFTKKACSRFRAHFRPLS